MMPCTSIVEGVSCGSACQHGRLPAKSCTLQTRTSCRTLQPLPLPAAQVGPSALAALTIISCHVVQDPSQARG